MLELADYEKDKKEYNKIKTPLEKSKIAHVQ